IAGFRLLSKTADVNIVVGTTRVLTGFDFCEQFVQQLDRGSKKFCQKP
ncbi:hypothetical protein KIPB_013915, partial [Kipferlia bialata]